MARLSQFALRRRRAGAILISLAVISAALVMPGGPPVDAADPDEVRILVGEPGTFDPAAQADVATAAVTAQLYETLTTYDASLNLQPALATTWDVADDGQRVVFHLRSGLTFSDGGPLTAEDVVGSWLKSSTRTRRRPSPR